jgi:hypothetical protein
MTCNVNTINMAGVLANHTSPLDKSLRFLKSVAYIIVTSVAPPELERRTREARSRDGDVLWKITTWSMGVAPESILKPPIDS